MAGEGHERRKWQKVTNKQRTRNIKQRQHYLARVGPFRGVRGGGGGHRKRPKVVWFAVHNVPGMSCDRGRYTLALNTKCASLVREVFPAHADVHEIFAKQARHGVDVQALRAPRAVYDVGPQ